MMRSLLRSSVLILLLSAPAVADQPAAPGEAAVVRRSFDRFAQDFLARLKRASAAMRAKPQIRAGADGPVATYRAARDGYAIELKATGNASTPWVGILRYTEQLFTCPPGDLAHCSVAEETPVTEVFRYRRGRWEF